MKSILTSFAIATVAILGFAEKASAHSFESRVYISGYRSCGTPIYTERYFVRYDRCGKPIWGTRLVSAPYRPVVRTVYVAPRPPVRYVAPRHCSGPAYSTGIAFNARWSR